ncbi:GNAT family N-acetyltransferase [Simiduia sp. 21SJ11W-1]|uniref:GNAT family N-acetyltransferase n=1 Tax=Simiduia sp. 21SJ11W-1 TaxID=2909669 RepID=UPI00209D7746|nr:GNAT family N-acetyltransferase [Simiduia sp. 21SJ11W-1]UTA48704.1 GNAT family N-acetyltransferase [Simiduia sp. 21SJ11W-1]
MPLRAAPQWLPELARLRAHERAREGLSANLAAGQAALEAELEVELKVELEVELEGTASTPFTLVAHRAQSLVGAATLRRQQGLLACAKSLWLSELWVHPRTRGQGLGAALIASLLKQAAQSGAPEVLLYTRSHRDYYRRLGWQLVREAMLAGQPVALLSYPLARLRTAPS